jgi:outer membrane protein
VGLSLEQPIGNRAAEAGMRQRRLERMQSVISYRNTLQQVVSDTKEALHRVALNYPLIEQTRTSRLAAAEVLRVAEVEKQQGFGYTVERLNIELNNQESLAAAEQSEIEAITDYNIALADLFLAMGTTLERNNIEFVVPGDPQTPSQ